MLKEAIWGGSAAALVFCVLSLSGCQTDSDSRGWPSHDDSASAEQDQDWIRDRAKRFEKQGEDSKTAAHRALECFKDTFHRFPNDN